MADVAAVPKNGLTLLSTFSGCGGSCLGFEMAGYRVVAASEFVPEARAVYEANHPDVPVFSSDIRTASGSTLLDLAGVTEVDVLEGSPPCASFSMSGKREQGWGEERFYSGKISQRTDDLFDHFIRLLGEVRPRAFVAENVKGMLAGKARGYFAWIMREFRAKGYRVEARLLDASYLGVPQKRERVIFMGLRNDVRPELEALPWPTPRPASEIVTVRQAVGGIEERGVLWDHDTGSRLELSALLKSHYFMTPPGKANALRFNLIRPLWDRPCPTIVARTGYAASICHPDEPRFFSLRELRALGSFPADFVLAPDTVKGTDMTRFRYGCERVGRSVPPLMMKAVAECLVPVLT